MTFFFCNTDNNLFLLRGKKETQMKVREKKKGGGEPPSFVVVSLLIDLSCANLNQPCLSSHYFSQCILL